MRTTPWLERKQAVVVLNPTARKLPGKQDLAAARGWLESGGWSVEWIETSRSGHATELAAIAAERQIPLLFVCGGDGTLNEAVNAVAGTETALGVIPAGTVNLWAREVGLLKRPLEAVQLAVKGVRRRVDLGRAGDRYFLLVAGFGLDAAVTHGVSHRLKSRVGAAAYALSAARQALRHKPTRATLVADGHERTLDLLMLIAGNTRNYAGLTQITSEALVDDGMLDLCAYSGRGRWEILWLSLLTLLRQHGRSGNVFRTRFRELRISATQPLPVQVDGEAIADRPLDVSVAPGALWVAVPASVRSPLFSKSAD
jgi:YegS/Rv2252/BmrU family lipid kinase